MKYRNKTRVTSKKKSYVEFARKCQHYDTFIMLGKKKKNVTLWPKYPTPVVSNYSLVNLSGQGERRCMEPRDFSLR